MKYFRTKYGTIIDENNVVIPMQEGNKLYNEYVSYLHNDGEIFETDFSTDTDLEIERKENLPQEVQLWRARTVLKLLGMEQVIEIALNSLEEPTKTGALYIWQFGTTVERNSQTVLLLQTVLGLTDAQVDDIFIQAENIAL